MSCCLRQLLKVGKKGKGKEKGEKKKEERFVQIEADEPQGVLL